MKNIKLIYALAIGLALPIFGHTQKAMAEPSFERAGANPWKNEMSSQQRSLLKLLDYIRNTGTTRPYGIPLMCSEDLKMMNDVMRRVRSSELSEAALMKLQATAETLKDVLNRPDGDEPDRMIIKRLVMRLDVIAHDMMGAVAPAAMPSAAPAAAPARM